MNTESIMQGKRLGRGLRVIGLACSLMIATGLVAGAPAAASSIKIIVNDHAITTMDIQGRARLLQVAAHVAGGAATKQAQEELIDEAVRLDAAKARGIVVPDDMVNEALGRIAAGSKMSLPQFTKALGSAGIPISSLRERIRTQMAWGRMIRARLQQQVQNQKADLIAQMRNQEKAASDFTAEDYVLQRVVFAVPRSASGTAVSIRQREAEALRGKFKSCTDGLAMAKTLKEVAVQNIGRKLAQEIPADMRDQLKLTDVGHLTKPIRSALGFEMLAVCDRIKVSGESAINSSIDAETMNAEGEKLSKQLTLELRQKAKITYR